MVLSCIQLDAESRRKAEAYSVVKRFLVVHFKLAIDPVRDLDRLLTRKRYFDVMCCKTTNKDESSREKDRERWESCAQIETDENVARTGIR